MYRKFKGFHIIKNSYLLLKELKEKCLGLPFPPLQITALESPTFATSKRSPTRMAVDAVEPASLFWVFSDFKNSESVWLYASAAETRTFKIRNRYKIKDNKINKIKTRKHILMWEQGQAPIADLVSEMNFGCLIKLLNRFCLTYSAARAPPWPEITTRLTKHIWLPICIIPRTSSGLPQDSIVDVTSLIDFTNSAIHSSHQVT